MTGEERPYRAYLLRLWQVNTATGQVWRASLEDPHTGERRGFASLESLFGFLKKQIERSAGRDEGSSPTES